MPSKAKRMLICVACYQFSSFSLSPQNYKSVVSTALFIPNVTAGDNYAQEARRGMYFGSSQEASGGSILQGRWATIVYGGCTLATGHFWGLFTEPPPVPRHHHGLWRLAKTRQGGGWGISRRKDEREGENEKQLRPFSLFTLCPPLLLRTPLQHLSNPNHHTSGQGKMSLFAFLKLVRTGEIRTDPTNIFYRAFCFLCTAGTNQRSFKFHEKEDNGLHSQHFHKTFILKCIL